MPCGGDQGIAALIVGTALHIEHFSTWTWVIPEGKGSYPLIAVRGDRAKKMMPAMAMLTTMPNDGDDDEDDDDEEDDGLPRWIQLSLEKHS